MTSLEYYIEQIEQFISALTDDIESGEGTIITQTKLAVYREVLEHLEEIEQEPCEDAISRQAVIDAMRKNHRSGGRDIDGDYIEGDYRECLYDDIISLPSVNPQDCDNCEVGNPCLYCKHEFEPQERSE